MRLSKLLLCLFLLSATLAHAQTVSNVQARVDGNNVIISYDLQAASEGQQFKVEIKSSKDNFTSPLKEVSGDVGENITPGIAKTVIWNAMKELGKFSGQISFDVVATVTFTPLKFTNPAAGANVKIGKSTNVTWLGAEKAPDLRMQLMRNNQQLLDIGNVRNTGSYNWQVPKSVDKGANYALRLSNPGNPSQSVMSAEFQLKKTSILVYVIPAVVVVGGVAAVLMMGGNDPPDPGPVNCTTNPTHPDCIINDPVDPLASPPPPPGGGS